MERMLVEELVWVDFCFGNGHILPFGTNIVCSARVVVVLLDTES